MQASVTVAWMCGLLVACSGHAEHRQDDRGSDHAATQELTYELDVDRAVDDKASDVRRDLEAQLADRKLVATVTLSAMSPGALTATSADATTRAVIEQIVKSDYSDTVETTPCAAPADPNASCMKIAAAYAEALKKAARDSAVTTIRARLEAAKVAHSSVGFGSKPGQIIVQFPAADPHGAAIRALISRAGTLEFKVVDDGSEYMRRLFVHVGNTRTGDATDERANHDGVQAEVDQWHEEDSGRVHPDFYLVAHDRDTTSGRVVLEKYLADLATKDPSFRVPDDRQIGYERHEPEPGAKDTRPYWRTYYLERAARLTGAAISNAQGAYDPNTNRPIVLLEFNRYGARVFGDLTAEIVGKKLATILDDQIKSAPVINGPIRGGRASITMGGSDAARAEAERDELVNVLKTGSLPSPLREVSSRVFP